MRGLSRYTDETAVKLEYIVLETIRQLQGETWQRNSLIRYYMTVLKSCSSNILC
ncbi:MAG: DUF3400 domain-containing protein [Candidatus Thiodiazotropha endolucinida]